MSDTIEEFLIPSGPDAGRILMVPTHQILHNSGLLEPKKDGVVTLHQFNLLKAEFDSLISQVKTLKRKVSELEEETQATDSTLIGQGLVLDRHEVQLEKLKRFKNSQTLNIPKVLEEAPVRVLEAPTPIKVYEAALGNILEQAEPTPKIYEAPLTPIYSPLYDFE